MTRRSCGCKAKPVRYRPPEALSCFATDATHPLPAPESFAFQKPERHNCASAFASFALPTSRGEDVAAGPGENGDETRHRR